MLVSADRMDHAAHLGDAEAVAHELADVVASVNAAITTLSRRTDAMVVVTGDHMTPLNGTAHSSEKVPVLIYGAGARSAAARAIGRSSADDALRPPSINASDIPLLFPFFPATGSRSCTKDAAMAADRAWVYVGGAFGAVAVVAAISTCVGARRRKKD